MTFWNFFGKHFLTSPYEYSNERVDDVIPSQFSIHFIYRNDKNLIFQLCEYKTCFITTQSKWEIMFTLIHFDVGICFYLHELKMKIIQNFIYNIYEKLWGDDIINSLISIFIRTGQEMFSEKMWISKCHIFLISHPIFIIFSLFCRKKFTLSFKIDSILEWISPLNVQYNVSYIYPNIHGLFFFSCLWRNNDVSQSTYLRYHDVMIKMLNLWNCSPSI